jgi:hypothetical protein
MKKIILFMIVGVLLLSGLGAGLQITTEHNSTIKTETIVFSSPTIQTIDDSTLVTIQNVNAWLRNPGAPMLPVSITTYVFPFGTTIKNVEVTFSEPQHIALEKHIQKTPQPVSQPVNTTITYTEQHTTGSVYPETPFEYSLGAGISNEQHVIYLNIRCYPVQYQSQDQSILYRNSAHISVMYELPTTQPTPTDDYKLVIIAPEKFASALEPLVNHKISKGLTTKLVTIDDISDSTYFPVQGRDSAEEMKYFIKDAFDQWETRYVLLVGGRYGGVLNEKWWVPVRYTNLDDGANWEGGYLSDLYFADIYDDHGNFSSWDSNSNGIFAEWNKNGKDILDMYPDLYVGRLACKTTTEVKTLVNKIITYETTTAGQSWFQKIVVVGGDSAPMVNDSFFEGEEENKKAIEYLTGFDPVKRWTSDGSFTGPTDVINAIDDGSGFLFFDGHGNPMSWSTHPPYNESIWINGLQVKDMRGLKNGEQLPVCVCGGCHNGQFNVSLLNILKGLIVEKLKYFQWTFYLGEWTPECWAWKLMSVKNGGSIATMAYTGLDWFSEGDSNHDGIADCTQYLSGFANTHFFLNYGVNNMTILGQAHTQALTDYLDTFPPMQDKLDCKTVQEFVLLGDPSLQIGGYT